MIFFEELEILIYDFYFSVSKFQNDSINKKFFMKYLQESYLLEFKR